jgi:phage terminase large subunit-like protein
MLEENDWRLTGQEKYLKGVTLSRRPYSRIREGWDHDHCAFCWAKFMETGPPDTLTEGYTTEDNYHWICIQCFEDFQEMFGWAVKS